MPATVHLNPTLADERRDIMDGIDEDEPNKTWKEFGMEKRAALGIVRSWTTMGEAPTKTWVFKNMGLLQSFISGTDAPDSLRQANWKVGKESQY